MNAQHQARPTGDRPVTSHQLTTTSAVCRWWQQRLDQELEALLFEGIQEVAPPATAGRDRLAGPCAADPGSLVVEAVPSRCDEPCASLWGDNSDIIADWFDQGECLAELSAMIEDSYDGSHEAMQEGL